MGRGGEASGSRGPGAIARAVPTVRPAFLRNTEACLRPLHLLEGAGPITTDGERILFWNLLPDFTIGGKKTDFVAMVDRWNVEVTQAWNASAVCDIFPKYVHHLRSYYNGLKRKRNIKLTHDMYDVMSPDYVRTPYSQDALALAAAMDSHVAPPKPWLNQPNAPACDSLVLAQGSGRGGAGSTCKCRVCTNACFGNRIWQKDHDHDGILAAVQLYKDWHSRRGLLAPQS